MTYASNGSRRGNATLPSPIRLITSELRLSAFIFVGTAEASRKRALVCSRPDPTRLFGMRRAAAFVSKARFPNNSRKTTKLYRFDKFRDIALKKAVCTCTEEGWYFYVNDFFYLGLNGIKIRIFEALYLFPNEKKKCI